MGLAVFITRDQINGFTICNQVRSFDLEAQIEKNSQIFGKD
jgi:hypothetical protein